MRYVYFFTLLFTSNLSIAQYKCLKFCFYAFNKNGSIEDENIHLKDAKDIRFQFTFFNCGTTNINIDTLPKIGNDYSTMAMFNNFGRSSLIVKISEGSNGTYYPLLNTEKLMNVDTALEKGLSHLKLLRPGMKIATPKTDGTNYFEYLPIGEYEISFDFVDEIKPIPNKQPYVKPKDSTLLSKYFDNGSNFSPGFYLQTSKNKIRFKIVE